MISIIYRKKTAQSQSFLLTFSTKTVKYNIVHSYKYCYLENNMDILEAVKNRHSVRRYMNISIKEKNVELLKEKIEEINEKTGLKIQLVLDEPDAFSGILAHYGNFFGVKNLFILAGPEGKDKEVGYYGEELVILSQQLGLNTCWVALTYNKGFVKKYVEPGDKLYLVISLGVGTNQGTEHKSKKLEEISNISDDCPDWFKAGVECASLAPTAINQQKFYFEYKDNGVVSRADRGPLTELDLGIAEYHFDIGSGKQIFAERLKNGR